MDGGDHWSCQKDLLRLPCVLVQIENRAIHWHWRDWVAWIGRSLPQLPEGGCVAICQISTFQSVASGGQLVHLDQFQRPCRPLLHGVGHPLLRWRLVTTAAFVEHLTLAKIKSCHFPAAKSSNLAPTCPCPSNPHVEVCATSSWQQQEQLPPSLLLEHVPPSCPCENLLQSNFQTDSNDPQRNRGIDFNRHPHCLKRSRKSHESN